MGFTNCHKKTNIQNIRNNIILYKCQHSNVTCNELENSTLVQFKGHYTWRLTPPPYTSQICGLLDIIKPKEYGTIRTEGQLLTNWRAGWKFHTQHSLQQSAKFFCFWTGSQAQSGNHRWEPGVPLVEESPGQEQRSYLLVYTAPHWQHWL